MSTVFQSDLETRPGIRQAFAEWTRLLGVDHVFHDEDTIDRYARTCIGQAPRPLGVIRPASTQQVADVVRIAAKHRVPIYPISRGKNWGYGSACPVTDGQVIVELTRMNRILEVNSELAYAVIEPGVSQGQLYEHLRELGDNLMLDVTGAGPDASIVGNALERGFGHSPYGDHFRHTCGMEVVLADGTVLNTGFGAFENAQAARVFPWGIGPWIDGLFSQSNLGIVTKLGVELMLRPPVCQAFAFSVPEENSLGDVVEILRRLRLTGVVDSTVHIANDLRVLSSHQRTSLETGDPLAPLSREVRSRLRRQAGLGAWNVIGGLYGTKESVAAARKVVRKEFRDVARVMFFGSRKLRYLKTIAAVLARFGIARHLQRKMDSAGSVYGLLEGVPSREHLKGLAWRSKPAEHDDISLEPTDFGGMWLSPVLPMSRDACRDVLQIVEPIYAKYGFDPLITFITVSPRALFGVLSVFFDKSNARERLTATECYNHLFEALVERGYVPYRVGIQSMSKLNTGSEMFWDVCQTIKNALDPLGILAPGRYQPGHRTSNTFPPTSEDYAK